MKSLLVFSRALGFLLPLARTGLAAPAVIPVPTKTTRITFSGTLQSNESYSTISLPHSGTIFLPKQTLQLVQSGFANRYLVKPELWGNINRKMYGFLSVAC